MGYEETANILISDILSGAEVHIDAFEYREMREAEHERDQLLDLIFNSIETPTYINPFKVYGYLEAVYPNRFRKKMESFNESGD